MDMLNLDIPNSIAIFSALVAFITAIGGLVRSRAALINSRVALQRQKDGAETSAKQLKIDVDTFETQIRETRERDRLVTERRFEEIERQRDVQARLKLVDYAIGIEREFRDALVEYFAEIDRFIGAHQVPGSACASRDIKKLTRLRWRLWSHVGAEGLTLTGTRGSAMYTEALSQLMVELVDGTYAAYLRGDRKLCEEVFSSPFYPLASGNGARHRESPMQLVSRIFSMIRRDVAQACDTKTPTSGGEAT